MTTYDDETRDRQSLWRDIETVLGRRGHLRPQCSTPGSATSPSGQVYDAALDRDGAVWIDRTPWARGGWMEVRGYTFAADDVPEWVTSCVHERICDTEGACVALLREDVTA